MPVKWFDFDEFDYVESGDENSLHAEVKRGLDVIMPGGKSVEVKKGDYLLVDKAGTEVFVLEKAKPVAKVKEVVKETFIAKVKNVTKKEKAKKAKNKPVLVERTIPKDQAGHEEVSFDVSED